MRRVIARRHFTFPINPAQPAQESSRLSLSRFSLPPPPPSLFRERGSRGLSGRGVERRGEERTAAKTEIQENGLDGRTDGRADGRVEGCKDGRKEGRKEGRKREHEEGVVGEVSRGRGAISRLSIMEPVRSYREAAARVRRE